MTTAAEEPVDPNLESEEVVEESAIEPVEVAPTAVEAKEEVDLFGLLASEFADATDNPDLDEVAKGITAESLKSMDPAVRASIRAILRAQSSEKTKLDTAHSERIKAAEAREIAATEKERKLNQRHAALLQMAGAAVKPVGKAPTSDPFSKEGIEERINYAVTKANADAWAPVLAERETVGQQTLWDSMVAKHPDFAKTDKDGKFPVVDEYDAFYAKYHKDRGIDLAKNPKAGLPQDLIADVFFADRARTALESDLAKKQERAAADRATSARAVGRGHGSGMPDALKRVLEVEKSGDSDALYTLLSTDKAANEAYSRHVASISH